MSSLMLLDQKINKIMVTQESLHQQLHTDKPVASDPEIIIYHENFMFVTNFF